MFQLLIFYYKQPRLGKVKVTLKSGRGQALFWHVRLRLKYSPFLMSTVFYRIKKILLVKKLWSLNFGFVTDFGGQINFYEKMDFFSNFSIRNKLSNQSSLKLIGLQVLGKFWLYRTCSLDIVGQKLSTLTHFDP